MKSLLALLPFITLFSLTTLAEDIVVEPTMIEKTDDPERITQIRKATELLKVAPEALRPTSDQFDSILKDHEGFRFLAEKSEQEILPKPAFEWIQNNLFTGIDKPFVGFFPLKEDDGEILGFVVVKTESAGLPMIYLVSPEGELKQMTRRL